MKKCALVIGHKKTSPGASNSESGLTEFAFNEALAIDIENQVGNVEVQRVYRRTYASLPSDINQLNPDFIVSLHCNAFNTSASGTEVLFYHRSATGRLIAQILQEHLVQALALNDRGIKPMTTEDRGGNLLKNTSAPCVIAEPFFIDNNDDLKIALDNRSKLVNAYAEAIQAMAQAIP